MKILLVMDQFNNGNNGTTISARRFADNLRKIGHEVRSLSIGETNENNFGLKQRNFGEKINKIISSQGMALAKPNKTIIEKALNWCDIVHFYMPFKLSKTTMQTELLQYIRLLLRYQSVMPLFPLQPHRCFAVLEEE